MIGNKVFIKWFSLLMFLSVATGCALGKEPSNILAKHFFTPHVGIAKVYFVGVVKNIGVSKFDESSCPEGDVCLHMPVWNLYEIEGYFLPKSSDEIESIIVAHKYGSALFSDLPWLATLEKIEDNSLKEKIGADYILVGVELGINVICPSESKESLFKNWKSDFYNRKNSNNCFSY